MRTRRGRGGREGTRGRHIRGEGWGRGSGETKTRGRKALASTDRTSKGRQAGSVLSKEDGSQNCRLSDAAPRATFCLPAALPAFSGPRPHGLRSQNAAGRDLAQDRPGSCRRARAMWENLLLRDRGRWREASGFVIPQGTLLRPSGKSRALASLASPLSLFLRLTVLESRFQMETSGSSTSPSSPRPPKSGSRNVIQGPGSQEVSLPRPLPDSP